MADPKKKTKPQTDTDTETPVLNVNPLRPGECKRAHEMRNSWMAYVPPTYTRAQLEDPRLYSFMSGQMLDLDKIELVAENGAFIAKGIVRKVLGREIQVQLYDLIELQPLEEGTMVTMYGFDIKFGGPAKKYYIQSKSTGDVVRDGLPTQMAAITYLTDHLKAKKKAG